MKLNLPRAVAACLALAFLLSDMRAQTEPKFEVLNPYGEVEPPKVRAPQPRLETFNGKTVGRFINMKRSARPIQAEVKKHLLEKFSSAKFSEFHYDEKDMMRALHE